MKHLLSLLILIPSLINALSIDEAIQKTIETNPQIEVKRGELNTEKELLTTAKSDYLPTIDITYSVGPESTKTIGNLREKVSTNRQDFSATLNQNIFSGFDTKHKVAQQEALILSASDSVQDSANSIALEAATAYIDILRSKELLDIAQTNVDVHKKYLDQIKEKADAGVGRASDYKQTLSRYENAQSTFFLTEQNYQNSLTSFKRIVDLDVKAQDLLKPTVGELPAQSLEELIVLSMENNPTINVSHADIKYAEAVLSRSNAAFYPKADIRAQSYWNKNLNGFEKPAKDFVEENGYNVLLVLSYNIFNGLADSSNKEANRQRVLVKNSSLADAKRFITASTTIAWQTFKSTEMQLVHIDRNIEASAQTVADYQEENDLGRRSIVDLLNIELEFNAAKNRKVTAEYDRLASYYQMLTHSGKMLEAMNIAIK
ncbi:MAG: TolC family outer membrane protein, partial [Sulfurimonas sp.]|nr:TolC family outer membrane protein [Sulfurimonas sp.]